MEAQSKISAVPEDDHQLKIRLFAFVRQFTEHAAKVLEAAPVVGDACNMFLSVLDLVETAKSNKEELKLLSELCQVVIEVVLKQRQDDHADLRVGFAMLGEHLLEAKKVCEQCNKRKRGIKTIFWAPMICGQIATVKNNILQFCSVMNLAVAADHHDKVTRVARSLDKMLDEAEAKPSVADKPFNIPPEAPSIREWYVERKAAESKACERLGVGRGKDDAPAEPQIVGLAGPSGVGKSTVASMMLKRGDVQEFFHKGVLWIRLGRGAKHRLPAIMFDLATEIWETVLQKVAPQPLKGDALLNSEDGAAYIRREMVDESSRRFLVVADDVWDVEVLRELKRAGLWVLYTTRDFTCFADARPLNVEKVQEAEAEMVLRQAAELGHDVRLPEAAFKLMELCEYVVLNLAMVGRWEQVHKRSDEQAWVKALNRIRQARLEGEKAGKHLSWRAAVLQAGLGILAGDNPMNKELYLALAILPTGLAFPSKVAGVLLHGYVCTPADLEAAERVLRTLERLSIVTLRDNGWFQVHDDHVDFVWSRIHTNQDTRDAVLPRWRNYISSVEALTIYSSLWLVKMWEVYAKVERKGPVRKPYNAVLEAGATSLSDGQATRVLKRAAEFHFCREDWSEAYDMYSELLERVGNVAVGGSEILALALAKILHNLGMCAYRVGKEGETERLLLQALTIQTDLLGRDSRLAVSTLHSLGVCIRRAGRIEEAEALLQQALGFMSENTKQEDPLSLARIKHSLGVCAYEAGRLEEAERYLREALVIREQKLGTTHREVAGTKYFLGECARRDGRTEQAVECLQRAREIFRQDPGMDRPDGGDALHSLGECAAEAGRPEEAESFYRQERSIRERDKLIPAQLRSTETGEVEEVGVLTPSRAIMASCVLGVGGLVIMVSMLWRTGRKRGAR